MELLSDPLNVNYMPAKVKLFFNRNVISSQILKRFRSLPETEGGVIFAGAVVLDMSYPCSYMSQVACSVSPDHQGV